jgi:hypothetical protein
MSLNEQEILSVFAARFVIGVFRERFVHEAMKKPARLHERICHHIQEVFAEDLKNGRCKYQPEEACWVLNGSKPIRLSTWQTASRLIGLGDGLLVIGSGGNKFYAETETVRGAGTVVYAAEG